MKAPVSGETLLKQLRHLSMTSLPVVCRDRRIGMKKQAQLARELFKTLSLKGIRVRMATGSMCFMVDVIAPRSHDSTVNRQVREHLEELLARTFPQHDDRSDWMSDYYDFRWSFGTYPVLIDQPSQPPEATV